MLASNNRYAIDALLAGHEPERYLDCVAPNPFIVKSTFETFAEFKSNEIYEKSLRVFLGFLYKVYASAAEGYQLYPVSIAEVNSLGKFLDESQEQDWPLNRGILDVLGGDRRPRHAARDGHREAERRRAGGQDPLGLSSITSAP